MITLNTQPSPKSKLVLSSREWAMIAAPATASFFLWCISIGADHEMVWYSLGALLVFPGVALLEIIRVLTGSGNIHGDRWDVLAIPMSALFVALCVLLRRRHLADPRD
jgi:hypothetical protein